MKITKKSELRNKKHREEMGTKEHQGETLHKTAGVLLPEGKHSFLKTMRIENIL